MGSPFTIIFYGEDSIQALKLSAQCFRLVDSLVDIYSDYKPESELNRLCAAAGNGKPFRCSPALFDILKLSKDAFEKSERTFDITLGTLTHLWRQCRKENKFPDSALVKEKKQLTGFSKLYLDTVNRTATLSQHEMQLDLGGIAQGYIAQKAIDFLNEKNIRNALVDASGDIVCSGRPPEKFGWTIAVSVPNDKNKLLQRYLSLTNCAVTTSGNLYQFIEHNGKRYSHLIDPSTGYGITRQINVTVISKEGTQADWLTKACSILPRKKAMKLAKRMGAALLIVESKKDKLIIHSSRNFKQFWKTQNN